MIAPASAGDRLIVALDVPTVREAERVVEALGDTVGFYKVGLELVMDGGLAFAERLASSGKKVFVDVKLHDIPATVEKATANAARLGATFLTVHAYPQTMEAAVKGASGTGLSILAVTVLTSIDDGDLDRAGYASTVGDLVARRAAQARDLGVHGLVMSPREVQAMRALVGPDMTIVTPGIRPDGTDVGDQKRVATPLAALRAGSDYLVVGRPVILAADPRGAAQGIVRQMSALTD